MASVNKLIFPIKNFFLFRTSVISNYFHPCFFSPRLLCLTSTKANTDQQMPREIEGVPRETYNIKRKPRDPNEPVEQKRARLLYQSYMRGTLETCLLMKSFAERSLPSMTPEQLNDYDRLLNDVDNEWDIYYWATGAKPVPTEWDSPVLRSLQEHIREKKLVPKGVTMS